MNDLNIPDEAPPPYSESLKPVARNGIPVDVRRSMEDEHRELPSGWTRQYDSTHHHHFYVDTRQNPPRSIWHHPYDDDEYLSTVPSAERERIQTLHRAPTKADIEAESTDEEGDSHVPHQSHNGASSSQASSNQSSQKPTLGRKLKDKLTGSTHEERQVARAQREEAERQYYERHRQMRMALSRATETGQPQHLGRDSQGHDLYIEPPSMGPGSGMYGYPGISHPPRQPQSSALYNNPNNRFIRAPMQYQSPMYGPYGRRPYGGYGGGMGMPLGLGLGGGLLGGAMLGGMLGGGF